MWHPIGWLFAGLFVGLMARLLLPGPQPMGCFMTAFCGIAGSLLAGAVAWMVWGRQGEPFSDYAWQGYILSIIGTMVLVGIAFRGQRNVPRGPVGRG